MNQNAFLSVEPLHVKVAGRARFRINDLRGNAALKSALETGLIRHAGIRGISASTLTGNMLVHFSPDRTHAQIQQAVRIVLDQWSWSQLSPDAAPAAGTQPAPPEVVQPGEPDLLEFRLAQEVPWHRMDTSEVAGHLRVSPDTGLAHAAARDRLHRKGYNVLKQHEARTGGRIFIEQFYSLPLLLLAVEAALALLSGAVLETAAVAGIVAANTAIGYLIDWRTQRADFIGQIGQTPGGTGCPGGRTCQVAGEELVPGDLLVLKPGTYVGADSRILAADNLKIADVT